MLQDGSLTIDDVGREVDLGHFRPSLLRDLRWRHRVPPPLRPFYDRWNQLTDRKHGFVKHKAVYDAKRLRKKLIKKYEAEQLETRSAA